MYLMDGKTPIMISQALNESDRLSSCGRSARRLLAGAEGLFNVYCFQTLADDAGGDSEDFLMRYNLGGICLGESAFRKLETEISLRKIEPQLPTPWEGEPVRLYHGVVPVGRGVFHKIAVREARIPHIDSRDFSLLKWTDRYYYEVCSNAEIYQFIEGGLSMTAAQDD